MHGSVADVSDQLAAAVAEHQRAQAELASAQAAVVSAQQEALSVKRRADAAREALAEQMRAAHADGMRVADLVRMTGYSREGVRKIVGGARPADEP